MQNNLITNQTSQLQENNFLTFFSKWLFFIDVKKSSLTTYNATIKQFLIYLQEHEITQPERNDILNYRDYLIAKDYKATTIKNKIQILKAFFQWLNYEDLYKDITLKIKTPKIEEEYKHDYLTQDQIKLLLNSIDKTKINGLRDYALILLMLTSGLRLNEVANTTKEDIQIKNGYIVLYILGKGHTTKDNYIILSDIVLKALNDYLEHRTDNNNCLFLSNFKKPLSKRQIENIINSYFVKIGIKTERLTTHSLRHTTATLTLLNGGSLEEVKTLLHHKSINTTLIYTHLLQREQNQTEQKISNIIKTLTTDDEI